MADSVFSRLKDKSKKEFVSVFVDDCSISTDPLPGESEEELFQRHLEQLEVFLNAASKKKIQFKLEKSKFCYERVPMLGFVVGQGKRTVQPGKAQALEEWPAPKSLDDVASLRAFANYLREFLPSFQEHDSRLKAVTKKGATW